MKIQNTRMQKEGTDSFYAFTSKGNKEGKREIKSIQSAIEKWKIESKRKKNLDSVRNA